MDQLSTAVLALSLIIIMLGMGLSLVPEDFKRILRYPKAMMVGLVNQLVFLPMIAFGILSLWPTQPEIAIGIMILAACPGGPTSNLIAHLAKGDTALSVSLTAINSIVTLITIPFIVNFALIYFLGEGQIIQLNIPQTMAQIMVVIVLPIIGGMLIRHYRPDFANRMALPVRRASGMVLALVIVGLVVKERANFVSYFQQAGLVALALNVVTMLIGYLSARLLKVADKMAISISIESGIQNGTLAITIAVVILGNAAFAIAPAIYSLLMFLTGGLAIYLGIRRTTANEAIANKQG